MLVESRQDLSVYQGAVAAVAVGSLRVSSAQKPSGRVAAHGRVQVTRLSQEQRFLIGAVARLAHL